MIREIVARIEKMMLMIDKIYVTLIILVVSTRIALRLMK